MDRPALDRDRIQRAGTADAALPDGSREEPARARRRIRSKGTRGAGPVSRRQGRRSASACPRAAGKPGQHLFYPWIGYGGALALALLDFHLGAQRRLSRLVGYDHGPAPAGPLLEFAREIIDQRARGI